MECLEKPKTASMKSLASLAEAVIAQSMSDLWDENELEESIRFFKGEGFLKYADISGMSMSDRRKLLEIVDEALKHAGKFKSKRGTSPAVYSEPKPSAAPVSAYQQTDRRTRKHAALHI